MIYKNIKPEARVEIQLWDWLKTNSDSVEEVYFNRKNLVNAPIFKVLGEIKEIPDMILRCNLFGKKEYIAIEIKDASKGSKVLSSCKIFSKYLKNYIEGKTKYFIEGKEIYIDKFSVATQFSPQGRLFEKNDVIVKNGSGSISDKWINKNVPMLEHLRTKDFCRLIRIEYTNYRKQTIKKYPGLGIIISDNLMKLSYEELEIQSEIKGRPIFQGSIFNPYRKNRNNKMGGFTQCLIKL